MAFSALMGPVRTGPCKQHSSSGNRRTFSPAASTHGKRTLPFCSSSNGSCPHTTSGDEAQQSRRQLLRNLGVAMIAGGLLSQTQPASAAPFLAANGARGLLAEEEQLLYDLRVEKEGAARQELEKARLTLEQEAQQSAIGKLCATPFGVDVVGITELVALIGALVGGVTARQRKIEMEKLNEQLRKINMSLRQQARAGTVYAPGLTYAPPPPEANGTNGAESGAGAFAAGVQLPKAASANPALPTASLNVLSTQVTSLAQKTLLSMEEDELSPDQIACRDALRSGKRFLKERNASAAMVRFEKALMLSRALGDRVQERRAVRGLAASARILGNYRVAIKQLERVLEISKEMKEYTGDADAYGTIADCYTDMGEFEKAAEYYDKYIERMNKDGPV